MDQERTKYFMGVSVLASKRSKCLSRQVGAVLISDRFHILSVGYNGPPSKVGHCTKCRRIDSPGKNLELCYAVHAEANALLQCRDINKISAVFTTDKPCQMCTNMLLNTSCQTIYFLKDYPHYSEEIWINQNRRIIQIDRFPELITG